MDKELFKFLDERIEKLRDKLAQFTKTRAWDEGYRLANTEFELLGMERAKRLIRKGLKASGQNQ